MKFLVLASTSPRRRDLLGRLGIPFEVIDPTFEETPTSLTAEDECLYFAEAKARSVAALRPGALILASDTLIDLEGKKLGKPRDTEDARRILEKLSGRTHKVHTGVVLLDTALGSLQRHLETARITFRTMTDDEIRAYVATGEPMGKAGAYAVQGRARNLFIERVEGDEEAVIGLPLQVLREWLARPS